MKPYAISGARPHPVYAIDRAVAQVDAISDARATVVELEAERDTGWLSAWQPADRSAEFDAIDWEREYAREVSR